MIVERFKTPKSARPRRFDPKRPPVTNPTGRAELGPIKAQFDESKKALQGQLDPLTDPKASVSEKAAGVLGAAFSAMNAPIELLDAGFASAASAILGPSMMPSFPAATVGSLHVGLPHTHTHPPALVPLPSIGQVMVSGTASVLVNGKPSARASDLGPAPTCGGFGSIFEVMTGSSSVFIGGCRAARMNDLTASCMPPNPAAKANKAMKKTAMAAQVASRLKAAAPAMALQGASSALLSGGAQSPLAAAVASAQATADMTAMALSMLQGIDPGIPPAVGALMNGSPNVLIGGFPMPDTSSILGPLGGALMRGALKGCKRVKYARKKRKVHKSARKSPDKEIEVIQGCGDPVSPVSGEVFRDFQDAWLDTEKCWPWGRHYRSGRSNHVGTLGRGYRHIYEKRLNVYTDHVELVDYDASTVTFEREEGKAHGGVRAGYHLWVDADGRYVLSHADSGVEYRFQRRPGFHHIRRAVLVEVMDPARGCLELVYNSSGWLVGFRDRRAGFEIELSFNANGLIERIDRVLLKKFRREVIARYEHDRENHLVKFIHAQGDAFTYAYRDGRITRLQGPSGFGFSWEYDGKGRCIHTKGDDGTFAASFEYLEQRTLVTEGDGGEWTYEYDAQQRLRRVIDPLGGQQEYLFDGKGIVVAHEDARGVETQWLYNDHGQHHARRDVFGAQLPTHYADASPSTGRELQIPADPLEYSWGVKPDAGRVSFETLDPLELGIPAGLVPRGAFFFSPAFHASALPRYTHNRAGEWTSHWDAQGRNERRGYNKLGQLIRIEDADGHSTEFVYGASWLAPKAVKDGLGQTTHFTYDHRLRVVGILDPGGHATYYERNQAGHIVGVLNDGQLEERYECDVAGRVLCTRDDQGNALVHYEYGPHGECVARTLCSGEAFRYDYDQNGMIVDASLGGLAVELGYDKDRKLRLDLRDGVGLRHQGVQGSGYVCELFDRFKTLYRKTSEGYAIQTPEGSTHHVAHRKNLCFERKHANGITELSHFDDRGLCTRRLLWRHDHPDTPVEWSAEFEYSDAGDLLQIRDSIRGEIEYSYDAAHRVMSIADSKGMFMNFGYDVSGNLRYSGEFSGLRYDHRNQIERAGEDTFEFDRRYRMSKWHFDADTRHFEYNGLDRLTKLTWGGGFIEWRAAYDGLGRRIYKEYGDERTEFFWEGDRLAAEIGPTGALRIYVYPGPDGLVPIAFLDYQSVDAAPESGELYTVHCDHLGMATQIRDAQGRVCWAVKKIDPFGKILSLYNPCQMTWNLRWPGHYYDAETGLHYNRFRYYSPRLGRFLRPDPLGQAGGINVYTYPGCPVNGVDVFGLARELKLCELLGNLETIRAERIESARKRPNVKLLEIGTYRDLANRSKRDGLTPDHIPSFRAIEAAIQRSQKKRLSRAQREILRQKLSAAVVIPTVTHQKKSRTYGGRNNSRMPDGRKKYEHDADDLEAAFDRDFQALREDLLSQGVSVDELERQVEQMRALNKRLGIF